MHRKRRNRQRNSRPHQADIEPTVEPSLKASQPVVVAGRRPNGCAKVESSVNTDIMKCITERFNDYPTSSSLSSSNSKHSCCSPPSSSPMSSSDDGGGLATPTSVPDTQYADFVFWKPLLPTVDDEITALFDDKRRQADRPEVCRRDVISGGEELEASTTYNEFNFWRAPIADIDVDLCQILASLEL